MPFRLTCRYRITWILSLVILVNACLPMASAWLARDTGNAPVYAELCTPSGLRMVALSADTPEPSHSLGGKACIWCLLQQAGLFVPTYPAPVLWLPDTRRPWFARLPDLPVSPLLFHALLPARGPPQA